MNYAVFYPIACVIGQATVGIAYMWTALEQNNLRVLVESAKSGGGRSSICDTADDNVSCHSNVPL